jgi:hypothetical protein
LDETGAREQWWIADTADPPGKAANLVRCNGSVP